MTLQEIISISIQIITLIGIIFAVFLYFKKPQERSEVNDAIFNERMTSYEKTTEKAVQLALNHSHTVESKIDRHINESQEVALSVAGKMGSIEAKLDMLINKR